MGICSFPFVAFGLPNCHLLQLKQFACWWGLHCNPVKQSFSMARAFGQGKKRFPEQQLPKLVLFVWKLVRLLDFSKSFRWWVKTAKLIASNLHFERKVVSLILTKSWTKKKIKLRSHCMNLTFPTLKGSLNAWSGHSENHKLLRMGRSEN